MAEIDRLRWNDRYTSNDAPAARTANRWLLGYAPVIDELHATIRNAGEKPAALDVACGAGGTLLWLAQRGWQVMGVDLSDAALAQVAERFQTAGCRAGGTLVCADLDVWRPEPASFDLVCSFFFLDRALWPSLRQAVKPGGLLALQTYNQERLLTRPTANPAYLLQPGELLAQVQSEHWEILEGCSRPAPGATDAVLARKRM